MTVFDALKLIGGLCLFLFGMNTMGEALERRAGNKLRGILAKMTTNKFAGFLTGCAVTAVIQSSSATTVMVVGFVNSGLMNLRQAINVIMGANVGTTVTSWILSLSGISSENVWVSLLKPSSFTPVLALVGIILYMFSKKSEKKDSGIVLLGLQPLCSVWKQCRVRSAVFLKSLNSVKCSLCSKIRFWAFWSVRFLQELFSQVLPRSAFCKLLRLPVRFLLVRQFQSLWVKISALV